MTERQWLKSGNLIAVLNTIAPWATRGSRKLRLFANACCREIWQFITDPRCKTIIEISEQYAEGIISIEAYEEAKRPFYSIPEIADDLIASYAHSAVDNLCHTYLDLISASMASYYAGVLLGEIKRPRRRRTERTHHRVKPAINRKHCDLIRDIFGNPFRRVEFNTAWRTSTLTALAKSINDNRHFADMAILADALEEAGCTSADILDHCRRPGEHVRGCWVVDLVLDKS